MAPDKIYVAESLIKTPYGNEWSPTPYISRENIEYIRKDALLEKINKTTEIVNGLVNDGYKRGCQIIIDQITYFIKSM